MPNQSAFPSDDTRSDASTFKNRSSRPRPGRTGTSRREFLRMGVGGAVAGGMAASAAQAKLRTSTIRREIREGVLDKPKQTPVRGTAKDPALLALIDRITYGYARSTYDEADLLGYQGFLDQQLDPDSIDDSAMDSRLVGYNTLLMSSQSIYEDYADQDEVPVAQLLDSTLLRAVYSKRQLHERMVEFWTDHFNIDIFDGIVPFLKTADDRDVIRQHALGKFPDLINASARSGAMLYYLDNYANVVGHAQENYARELMELHTVGVDGGYTQQDVEEVARCLTGWTLYGFDAMLGNFVFYAPNHDVDPKTVLGTYIPMLGGESDGQTVLDILAYHPNTARFIAHKLCVRFLGYDPPEDVVELTKSKYLETGGDIKEMLRVILDPDVLLNLRTPKLKRPYHLMASILRATEADISVPRFVRNYLFTMGHIPFFWPTPDGYPDTLAAWGSSLLPRWQMVTDLLDGQIAGVTMDLQTLFMQEGGGVVGSEGEAINSVLTGGQLPASEVSALQQLYDDITVIDPPATLDTFGVAASLPGYQWY